MANAWIAHIKATRKQYPNGGKIRSRFGWRVRIIIGPQSKIRFPTLMIKFAYSPFTKMT